MVRIFFLSYTISILKKEKRGKAKRFKSTLLQGLYRILNEYQFPIDM